MKKNTKVNNKAKSKKIVHKKKNVYKKEESGGFTLVELLAVIAILSLVVSIGIYTITSIIGKAKEKTYLTTVNEIEKAAGNYALEFKGFFSPSETNLALEQRCIKVQDLIEAGFLDNNVTNASINSLGDKVEPLDYIYLARDKTTKAILKKNYTKNNGNSMICQSFSSTGSVVITVLPGTDVWSAKKDITITYKLNERDGKPHDFVWEYLKDGEVVSELSSQTPATVGREFKKEFTVYYNGQVFGEITGTSANNSMQITKIDGVKPVIKEQDVKVQANNVWQTKSDKTIYLQVAKGVQNVHIPFKVTDCARPGNECSGIVKDRARVLENLVVKIGGREFNDYNLTIPTACGSRDCSGEYTIEINIPNAVMDGYTGNVEIGFKGGAFIDHAKNESDEFNNPTNIVIDDKVNLTFDSMNGTYTGPNPMQVYYGRKTNNQLTILPTKEGYDFTGWYNAKVDGQKVYDANGRYYFLTSTSKVYWDSEGKWEYGSEDNVTLYAHWSSKTVEITMDPNGGTYNGDNPITVYYNRTNKNKLTDAPTRNGYTFTGWYTTKTGGTKIYNADGSYSESSNQYWNSNGTWKYTSNSKLTLYAHWTANPVQIAFDANGGTYTGRNPIQVYYGQTTNNKLTVSPTKANSTFLGWYTTKTGGTKVYNANGNYNTSSSNQYWASDGTWKYATDSQLKLYAHWQASDSSGPVITTEIKYSPDGGKTYAYYDDEYYSTCAGTKDSEDLPSGCSQNTKWFKYKPTLVFEITDPSGVKEDDTMKMEYNQFGLASLNSGFTGSRKIGSDQDKALKKVNGKFYTNITTSGVRHIKLTACDATGNCSYQHVFFKFDNEAPTIGFSRLPGDSGNKKYYRVCNSLDDCVKDSGLSWFSATPRMTLTPADALSGLGTAKYYYNYEDKSSIDMTFRNPNGTNISYTNGSIVKEVGSPGNRYIKYEICDKAGNCTYKYVFFKYENEVSFDLDLAKTRNTISNRTDLRNAKVFKRGYLYDTIDDCVDSLCKCYQDSSKTIKCAQDYEGNRNYFGISCMNVHDYKRYFTISSLSAGTIHASYEWGSSGGIVTFYNSDYSEVITGSELGTLVRSVSDARKHNNTSVYANKYYYGNLNRDEANTVNFSKYGFTYTSSSGKVAPKPVQIFVQYTDNCGY